jgi:hypothetical protein
VSFVTIAFFLTQTKGKSWNEKDWGDEDVFEAGKLANNNRGDNGLRLLGLMISIAGDGLFVSDEYLYFKEC